MRQGGQKRPRQERREQHSIQREDEGLSGEKVPGVFGEQQGGQYGLSRVSEKEWRKSMVGEGPIC